MTTKRILLAVMCTLLFLVIVMSCIVFHRVGSLFSGIQISPPPAANTPPSQQEPTQPPSSGTTESTQPSEPSRPTEPPHEHEYVKTSTVSPTCTAFGYTVYTCSCGKTDLPAEEFRQPFGHNYIAGETVERTCTTDGYTPYTCKNCGDLEKRDLSEAEGHSFGIGKVTKPTCTEDGYTAHTCTLCNESVIDDYVEAAGHNYDEWTVVTEAQNAAPGIRQRVCDICDEVDSEVIPPTGELKITDETVFTMIDPDNVNYFKYVITIGTDATADAYTYTINSYMGRITCTYGSDGLSIFSVDSPEVTLKILPPYMDSEVTLKATPPVDPTPEDPEGPSGPTDSTGPSESTGSSEVTDTTESTPSVANTSSTDSTAE